MSDARMPPRAAWPSFPWKDSGWWLAVAAMVATLAFFIAPELMALDTRAKLLVSGLLLASPVPFIALRYAGAAPGVIATRVRYYPALYRRLEESDSIADALKQHLNEQLTNRPSYEIVRVHWFQDREEMYLLIRKKAGRQPRVGTPLTANNLEDGRVMAELEIMEVRSDGYHAKVTGYVDHLWLGEVKRRDLPELPPPPGVSAFMRPRREGP